jgi:pimeloyl-ACP methyl ester carboxylesterase|nr:alpha/beta hydrolase [Deltaproteobacteria bacterium]
MAINNHLGQLDRPEIINFLFRNRNSSHGTAEESRSTWKTTTGTLTAKSSDGIDIHCRIFSGIPEEPHILFFPAEYDHETDIMNLATGFGQIGITLITTDYRGCRDSGGEPSVSTLPQDAEAFYQAVKDWYVARQRTGPFVFMGRSLGSAVALDLAFHHNDDSLALIMESSFDLTEDFLSGNGIQINGSGLSGEDPFSNRSKMNDYSKAVLFLHSHRDEVISLNQIEWLVAESRSKATQLQIVPSECRKDIAEKAGDLYFAIIKDFLNRRMGRRLHRRRKKK